MLIKRAIATTVKNQTLSTIFTLNFVKRNKIKIAMIKENIIEPRRTVKSDCC
jgi:hypothetical protein